MRDPEVGAIVSRVAEHPAVRSRFVAVAENDCLQRPGGDGRPRYRHRRRSRRRSQGLSGRDRRRSGHDADFGRAAERGSNQSFEAVLRETLQRDAIDSGRHTAPLRPASDAVQIETDGIPIDQIVAEIEALARAEQGCDGRPCLAVVSATTSDGAPSDLLAGTFHGRPRAILRAIVLALLRPLLSLRLIGVENVPADGPLLVASNHLSNADPIILEAAFPRPLFFLGKAELFRNPFFRWVLRRFGGIPVERGTPDLAAIRRAARRSRAGDCAGDLPEGVRSRTVALVKGLPGAGLIALQSKAPVLPVAIYGTEFFPVNGEIPPRRPKDPPARRHGALRIPDSTFPNASTESE